MITGNDHWHWFFLQLHPNKESDSGQDGLNHEMTAIVCQQSEVLKGLNGIATQARRLMIPCFRRTSWKILKWECVDSIDPNLLLEVLLVDSQSASSKISSTALR